jgi:hypothetical protein
MIIFFYQGACPREIELASRIILGDEGVLGMVSCALMTRELKTFGPERLASSCAVRLTALTVAQASVRRPLTAPAPPAFGPRWAMPSAAVQSRDPRRLTASLSGHASHHP